MLLAGCAADQPPAEAPLSAGSAEAAALLPTAVADKGTLVVAMEVGKAPFQYYDVDNKTFIGAEVELAEAIASALGLEIVLQDVQFDSIIPGVESAKYDLGISGFGATAGREQIVDTVSYMWGGAGIMVLAGNPKHVALDKLCGQSIGSVAGSIQGTVYLPEFSDECVANGEAAIELSIFPSTSDAQLALNSGRVDGMMLDTRSLAYQAEISKGAFELTGDLDYQPIYYAIIASKTSEIAPAIQAALLHLRETGGYQEILDRWGMGDFAVENIVINAATDGVTED